MSPEEAIAELKQRSKVMESMVEILNLFGRYVDAEDGSEMEKLLEKTMEDVALEIIRDGSPEQAVNLIFGLASTIIYCAPGDKVQHYISTRQDEIHDEYNKIREQGGDGN